MNTYNNIINITSKAGKTVSFVLSNDKKRKDDSWSALVEKPDGTPVQFMSARTKGELIELLNVKANEAKPKTSKDTLMNRNNTKPSAPAQATSTTRAILVIKGGAVKLLSAKLDEQQLAIADSANEVEFKSMKAALIAAKESGLTPFLVFEEKMPLAEWKAFASKLTETAKAAGLEKGPKVLLADEVTGALKFLWGRANQLKHVDVGHPRGKGGVVLLLTPLFPDAHDLIMRACELLEVGEKVRILAISVAEKRFICDEIRNMGFKYLCPVAVWEKQLEEAN